MTRQLQGGLPRVAPMLAVPGTVEAVTVGNWAFEMKWDGMRTVLYAAGGRLTFRSRNDTNVTASFPELGPLAAQLDEHDVVLDGEIVAFAAGRPDFHRLQKRINVTDPRAAQRLSRIAPVTLLLFDVMFLDGQNLLRQPYTTRRRLLEALALSGAAWRTPARYAGSGADAIAFSQTRQLEGVIAKRLDSIYSPGRRSSSWLKIKNVRAQEVLIGGWLPGAGRRAGTIGALLVGVPSANGLRYAGRVGAGFTDAMLSDLAGKLARLGATRSPFINPPGDVRDARWVAPRLVGEVAFTEWTGGGRMRHPAWRGLRPDKNAKQITQE